MNTIMSIHVVSPKRKKLARVLLIFGICLTMTVATVVVLEETTHVVPATAASFDCVAGLLATGATFISLAIDPPLGIAALFGWGGGAVGMLLSYRACQNPYMKSLLARAYLQHHMDYVAYFTGYFCTIKWLSLHTTCWAQYAGGGGSSGSW